MTVLLALLLLAPGNKQWSQAHQLGASIPKSWKILKRDDGARAFVIEGPLLGDGKPQKPVGDALYSELGQSTLVTFAEPYRAAAFVASLERQAPGLHLDWFRRGVGSFEVVMTYADRDEFDSSARKLQSAGFRID